jgi:cob(I)alamin adenosyltransferase
MKKKKGLIYIFEGNGKGKTSAALGVALRTLLLDKRVVWVSWFKEESWKMSEIGLSKKFPNNLKMYWGGKGFFGGPLDHDTPDGHKNAAAATLLIAKTELTKKEEDGGILSLMVLDEVIRAVNDGVISLMDVLDLVKSRGETNLVLTGHSCPSELVKIADLVTDMQKVKHPYDKGILAVRGLDF